MRTPSWRKVINFDALVEFGAIAAEDLKLLSFVDTPDEAMQLLQKELSVHFAHATPDAGRDEKHPPEPETPDIATSCDP